jgi:predicted secreted hydrolase
MITRRSLTWACGLGVLHPSWGATTQSSRPEGSANTADAVDAVREGQVLQFPRDHGAHLGSRIEWWYATGWLRVDKRPGLLGFQVTFFRSRTGLATELPGRLAPRQVLFAHAALTDAAAGTHVHADRVGRWAGQNWPDLRARASTQDADVALAGWTFKRSGPLSSGIYQTRLAAPAFAFDLALQSTQALLLQGQGGFSRKGPQATQASHYTSETQLQVSGHVQVSGKRLPVREGRAWIDHEWSNELLHPQAVGWDWVGINLDDGSALTAYRVRRADGGALWAGGSFRSATGITKVFSQSEVQWTAGRQWRSPQTNANYPVEWTIQTPSGHWQIRSLLDKQELDSRNSTGTIYWEGLVELRHSAGTARQGLGYLEMTGYAGRLQL